MTITGPATYPIASLAAAVVQPLDVGAGLVSNSLDLYIAELQGFPTFAVEVANPPYSSGIDSDSLALDADGSGSGFLPVGAASIVEALSDDSDATYAESNDGDSHFLVKLSGPDFSTSRIGDIRLTARIRAGAVGVRWWPILSQNDETQNGPSQVAPSEWTTITQRWAYNPQGRSLWSSGDANRFALGQFPIGIAANGPLQVAQLDFAISSAGENRKGTFSMAWRPAAKGWHRLVMDADIADGDALVLMAVVANNANYAIFGGVEVGDPAFAAYRLRRDGASGLVTPTRVASPISGQVAHVFGGATSAAGQRYRDGRSVFVSVPARRQNLDLTGAIDAVAIQRGRDSITPTLPLTVTLDEAESAQIPPGKQAAYFTTPTTDPTTLDLTASVASPWAIVRAESDPLEVGETLSVLPASTRRDDGWLSTEATAHEAVDDSIGVPDDDATFVQQGQPDPLHLSFQAAVGSLDGLTGRDIASVDVVARVGSGQATSVQFAALLFDGVDDWFSDPMPVATGWQMRVARFEVNPATSAAWTPAEVQEFAGSGDWSFGLVASGGDILCTQLYLRVNFADTDNFADALSIPGYAEDAEDSDYIVFLGTRPPPPENLTAASNAPSAGIDLAWTGATEDYRVYRDGVALDQLSIEADDDTFTAFDWTAPIGVDVSYAVVAVDGLFESEPAEVEARLNGGWIVLCDSQSRIFAGLGDLTITSLEADRSLTYAQDGHFTVTAAPKTGEQFKITLVVPAPPNWAEAAGLLDDIRFAWLKIPASQAVPVALTEISWSPAAGSGREYSLTAVVVEPSEVA